MNRTEMQTFFSRSMPSPSRDESARRLLPRRVRKRRWLVNVPIEGAKRQLRLGEQEGLAKGAILPLGEINARLDN
jgi:hypothetical protein